MFLADHITGFSRKEVTNQVDFSYVDKSQFFKQGSLIYFDRHDTLVQSTQKSEFSIFQQYFKKEVRDNFGSFHEDKHEVFLKFDPMVFVLHSQTCPKYPKLQFYKIFAMSQEEWRDEVDFFTYR